MDLIRGHATRLAVNICSTVQNVGLVAENVPGTALPFLLRNQVLRSRTRESIRVPPIPSNDHIINLEDPQVSDGVTQDQPVQEHHHHRMTRSNNFSNNIHEPMSNRVHGNQNNNNNAEGTFIATHGAGITEYVEAYLKYIIFVSLTVVKILYDHRVVLLNVIVLLGSFAYANEVLKREILKRRNKSWISLLIITCYIIACITFITFDFGADVFFPFAQPLTLGELLWSGFITDFVLKLITILFKVFLTCLPETLLSYQKRGKYYVVVEATSQLCRSVLPFQSFIYYLCGSNQGTEFILGGLLSTLYGKLKLEDLMTNIKLLYVAVWKFKKDMSCGTFPSKEELIASGGMCSICHNEYSMPVRLFCSHIFCEECVLTWFSKQRSCPLCRAKIEDVGYLDGHTTYFVQFF